MPTICHSKKCQLNEQPIHQDFGDMSIYYCPECFKYAMVMPLCEHVHTQVFFVYENGKKLPYYVCPKCNRITADGDEAFKDVKVKDYVKWFRNSLSNNAEYKKFAIDLYNKNSEFEGRNVDDWWLPKRKLVLKNAGYKCSICESDCHEAHVLQYIIDGKEVLFSIESICKSCYENYNITHIEI